MLLIFYMSCENECLCWYMCICVCSSYVNNHKYFKAINFILVWNYETVLEVETVIMAIMVVVARPGTGCGRGAAYPHSPHTLHMVGSYFLCNILYTFSISKCESDVLQYTIRVFKIILVAINYILLLLKIFLC